MSSNEQNESHRVRPKPRLSIVIATWNASTTLQRCVRSIVDQRFVDWELLISDGNSTDGTVELIRQYEDHIAWWQSKPDNGIYDAWNQALANAKGEYVCFLGADDAWSDPCALERLFDAMHGQIYDLVTSRGLIFAPQSDETIEFGGKWSYQRIGRRVVVCHPGLLHRQSLFRNYGLFDTRYRIAGDLEFLLRLPADLNTLDVPVISVRVQGGGISRKNFFKRLREQREILKRDERFGVIRAYLIWFDRLWRYPIARLFRIPY